MFGQNYFQVFGQIDLQKSMASIDSGEKDILIKGRILNAVRDQAGETPIVSEFDWSYFDKFGFLKYEHDPVEVQLEKSKVTQRSFPDPENIIGVPLKREAVGNKEVHIIGTLFPQVKKAQALVTLMKAVSEHNKRYPAAQRTVGFSVEGSYLKKSGMDGKYAGKVINVVVSPQPIDATTYAQIVERENLKLAKSLEAGYATDPAQMAGGDALRKQSLEGAKSQQKETKKMKFKNRDEAYTHFMKEHGNDKTKAKGAVDAHFAQEVKDRSDKNENMGKSLTNALGHLQKSVEALTTMGTLVDAQATQIDTHGTEIVQYSVELKKSVAAIEKDEALDGVAFMASQGKAIVSVATLVNDLAKLVGDTQKELQKSISSLASGITEFINFAKASDERSVEALEVAASTNEDVRKLYRNLQKSMLSTTRNVAGVEAQSENDEIPDTQLLKSVGGLAIEDFLVNKGSEVHVTQPDKARSYFSAQEDFKRYGLSGLNKSIVGELVAHFKPIVEANRK